MNVVGSYNVMRTAADNGIRKIVQASSVNATGLIFTHESRRKFEEIPLTEMSPRVPEDAYSKSDALMVAISLMKSYFCSQVCQRRAFVTSPDYPSPTLICPCTHRICEIQADSICRLYDDCRISSLRFHMTCDRDEAIPRGQKGDLWSWTSLDDAANACLLGITANETSFQRGHEPFYILHDDLFLGKESWEVARGVYDEAIKNGMNPDTVTAKELIDLYYPNTKVREGWFDGNPRRSLFDNAKAKEMLGWDHVK